MGVCRLIICFHVFLEFDMQHDHVLKKLNFDLLRGVCGQNICCHVDAFMIIFNLICNMTMF